MYAEYASLALRRGKVSLASLHTCLHICVQEEQQPLAGQLQLPKGDTGAGHSLKLGTYASIPGNATRNMASGRLAHAVRMNLALHDWLHHHWVAAGEKIALDHLGPVVGKQPQLITQEPAHVRGLSRPGTLHSPTPLEGY